MFGIGIAELLFILVIAFVVLGPEQLYELSRAAGRIARKLKSLTTEINSAVAREINISDFAPNRKGDDE